MDGQLLLASQLTGGRQWPHCVRGLDLDFLPLSSPRSDWPGVGSATVGGPGAGHAAMGSRRGGARASGPVPEEAQGRQTGPGPPAQKAAPFFERQRSVEVTDWNLQSEIWLQISYGSSDTVFTTTHFFF